MTEATAERPSARATAARPPGPGAAPVRQDRIVNLVNRAHFQDGELLLLYRAGADPNLRSARVRPDPCCGGVVTCRLPAAPGSLPPDAVIVGFTVEDGRRRVLVQAAPVERTPDLVRLPLGDGGLEQTARAVRRHPCRGVRAALCQGGEGLTGEVRSFSASAFSVAFPHARAVRLDPALPVAVTMRRQGRPVFEGLCEVARTEERGGVRTYVLRPCPAPSDRRPALRVTPRQRPAPAPHVAFRHPITDALVSLRAEDVSGSGFSVEEEASRALLLPGLLLGGLRIELVPGADLVCRGRVVHAEPTPEGARRCGIEILEMSPEDHARLCSFVHGCRDRHATVSSTSISLDALWDFFFETGFLYPEKYAFLQEDKEEFKRLYERLYLRPTAISRHILYQERGRILGHMSLFRWYRRCWVIHHHAAVKSVRHKAGLAVLEHILHHLDELHRLPAARMRYCACYYRPENHFANRIFTGAAAAIAEPAICSVDPFAYRHHAGGAGALPPGWALEAAAPRDLEAFAAFYRRVSGGLMLAGLDLLPDGEDDAEIDAAYAALGLVRRRLLFALRERGETAAVFVVAISDLGLNLSDLTNCITCLTARPRPLPAEATRGALDRLAGWYRRAAVPVLFYPADHAAAAGFPAEKTYLLSMLDPRHIGRYIEVVRGFTATRAKRGRPNG